MRTMIYSFTRHGVAVAELRLQLRPGGSVERAVWISGQEMRKTLSSYMPAESAGALLEEWHVAIMRACDDAGLAFIFRYEGEPAMPDNVVLNT